MSATLAATRRAVRLLLRDTDARDYAVPSDEMDRAILRHALEIGEDTGLGEAWATVATLSDSGSTDFAMSLSSSQLSNVRLLRLASSAAALERVTDEQMESFRASVPVGTGEPSTYTLIEGTTQGVTLRLYPRPIAADTVEALIRFDPSQTVADATVIPLADLQLRAAELGAAAELLASLPPETQGKLGVSNVVVPVWQQAAERMRRDEKERRARQKRSAFVSPAVW